MKNHFLNLVAIFLLLASNAFSIEEPDIKFGKISKSDFEIDYQAIDSSADAVMIYDKGTVDFEFSETEGVFSYIYRRHCRLKILKKTGYDWADFSERLYDENGQREILRRIKGITYNLVDGNIEESKLSRKSQFHDKVDDHNTYFKFTMPDVKEGSIIDVTYEIQSPFKFYLPLWQFQYSIPVIWSEYVVSIPEYYVYKKLFQGYLAPQIHDVKQESRSLNFTRLSRETGSNQSMMYSNTTERFVITNSPAFKDEKYISSIGNYISKVEFELSSIKFPRQPIENFNSNWTNITKELIEDGNFGLPIKNSLVAKREFKELYSSNRTQLDMAVSIYTWIQKTLKWNGSYGIYTENGFNKSIKERSGSVGDINLFLVHALKEAGIEAYPVIMSTRSHGLVNVSRPMLTQFNYVTAYAIIDGKGIFLDATNSRLPFGMLPSKCLNDRGRIIDKEKSDWVNIPNNTSFKTICMSQHEILEDGTINGEQVVSRDSYSALWLRNKISNAKDTADFIKELEDKATGLKYKSYEFENIDSIYKSTREKYTYTISDKVTIAGEMMLITPMLFDQVEKNPFTQEKRHYPIDFNYPYDETLIYSYTIPEGWEIEELPESTQFALPNNNGSFTYSINKVGNNIQVMVKQMINKNMFLPDEYDALKMFYALMIEKEAEQIVLKKIN